MAAFSPQAAGNLLAANEKLAARMASIYDFRLDRQQVYDTIIPEDDRTILKRAAQLGLRGPTYHSYVQFKHEDMAFRIDLDNIGLLPKSLAERTTELPMEYEFAPDLVAWGKNVRDVVHAFIKGRAVLEALFDTCKTAKQVRYFLPGIVVLARTGGYTELADRLADTSIIRNPPSLPVGMRPYVAEYNALISKASLIPANVSSRLHPVDKPYITVNSGVLCPWKDEVQDPVRV